MTTFYNPMPVAATTFTSDSYTGGSVPASFDAFLYKPIDWGQLKLTIRLRIKLRQLPPKPIPIQLDADGKVFWTSPWTGTDWQRFIRGAAAQADMWNNKFWLLPPTTSAMFSEFDLGIIGTNQAQRPNIRCELSVDFEATDNPHRTIDVANLNTQMLALQGQPRDPGTFRSHALLYDSLDTVPWAFPYGPGAGQPTKHYVIAHEIGHAIGLGHIGTILKTTLCEYAIASEKLGYDRFDPNSLGGRNSFYCYGLLQGIAVVGNIMGAGDSFTVDNARPWLWAMMSMGKIPAISAHQWRVVMTDPGPGSWVKK